MEVVRELRKRVEALDQQVKQYEENVQRLLEYQETVLKISEIWSKWVQSSDSVSEEPTDYAVVL